MTTLASSQQGTLRWALYLQIQLATMIACTNWTNVLVCEDGNLVSCDPNFHLITAGVESNCTERGAGLQATSVYRRRVNRRCFHGTSCALRPNDVTGEDSTAPPCGGECLKIEMMCVQSTVVHQNGTTISARSGFVHPPNDTNPAGGSTYTMYLADTRVAANVSVFLYDWSAGSIIEFCGRKVEGGNAHCEALGTDAREHVRLVNMRIIDIRVHNGTWFLLEFVVNSDGRNDSQDSREPIVTGLKDAVTVAVEDGRLPNIVVDGKKKPFIMSNEILYGVVIGGTLLVALILVTMVILCVRRHRNKRSSPRESQSIDGSGTPSRGISAKLSQRPDFERTRHRHGSDDDRYITTAPDVVNLDQYVNIGYPEDGSQDVGRYFQVGLNHEYENVPQNRDRQGHDRPLTPDRGTPTTTHSAARLEQLAPHRANEEIALFENDLYNRELSRDHAERPAPDVIGSRRNPPGDSGVILHENDLYQGSGYTPVKLSSADRRRRHDSGHVFIVENRGYDVLPVGLQ